ncbi:MAG: Uma2 family endonuclease [Cyanobacteria bacterium J06649_4]
MRCDTGQHDRKDSSPQLTPEEYFDWEEKQQEKHEYINGQVYAMSGGTVNHSRLSIRLTALLDEVASKQDCIAGNSDLKVNVVGTKDYTYPDASVTCDDRDKKTTKYITYPCLVVEVLSESTEAYDRGAKFRRYRNNPQLRDYLLVSTDRIEMDLYHKNDNGDWLIRNYQAGDTIVLKSIGLSFPIEQIYSGLTLVPEETVLDESA